MDELMRKMRPVERAVVGHLIAAGSYQRGRDVAVAVSDAYGYSEGTVHVALSELLRAGHIVREGRGWYGPSDALTPNGYVTRAVDPYERERRSLRHYLDDFPEGVRLGRLYEDARRWPAFGGRSAIQVQKVLRFILNEEEAAGDMVRINREHVVAAKFLPKLDGVLIKVRGARLRDVLVLHAMKAYFPAANKSDFGVA